MKAKCLLFVVLFFSMTYSCFAQAESALHFFVDGFEYKLNGSEVRFNLKIENWSNDTVSIVKPLPSFFGKTYYASHLDGIKGSPYSVNLISTENPCDVMDDYRKDPLYPNSIRLDSFSILVLSPGETKTYDGIKLKLTTEPFCANREYSIEINYNLRPYEWDGDEVFAIKQSIEKIDQEIETYNKQIEKKDYDELLSLKSNSRQVLKKINSLEIVNTLYPKIVTSNSSDGKAY